VKLESENKKRPSVRLIPPVGDLYPVVSKILGFGFWGFPLILGVFYFSAFL